MVFLDCNRDSIVIIKITMIILVITMINNDDYCHRCLPVSTKSDKVGCKGLPLDDSKPVTHTTV